MKIIKSSGGGQREKTQSVKINDRTLINTKKKWQEKGVTPEYISSGPKLKSSLSTGIPEASIKEF